MLFLPLSFANVSEAHTCADLLLGEVLGPKKALPVRRSGGVNASDLYRFVVFPVVVEGQRSEFVRRTNLENGVKIESHWNNETIGTYIFEATSDPLLATPGEGLPEIEIKDGKIFCRVVLYVGEANQSLERMQGIVRSAFRADPFLHPHRRPTGWGDYSILSNPQNKAVAALLDMEDKTRWAASPMRGLLMSVGMGKTVTSAHYVNELGKMMKERRARGWRKPPRVLFVVENGMILDDAVPVYSGKLGYQNIARIYDNQHEGKIDPNVEMIAITRSSYAARMREIHDLMNADSSQPWAIVIDEAHHTGTYQGQFEKILEDLENVIAPNHRVLKLSASLHHRDRNLITRYLKGNVYGAMLNDAEQVILRRGEQLPDLCRIQLFRGMHLGYLSPIFELNLITELSDGTNVRSLLSDFEVVNNERIVKLYPKLVKDLADGLLNDRKPEIVDRGIVFVPMRAMADGYAPKLQKALGNNSEVRPFHGGADVEADTLDWYNNAGKYDNDGERAKHKYLIVVDILREGVNLPATNIAVLWRTYAGTANSFALLLQNIGRADRIDAFKPYFRIYDYTGFSRKLRNGLSGISVESTRENRRRSGQAESRIRVNRVEMSVGDFVRNYYRLFPEDATFKDRYRFFDGDKFRKSGLVYLHQMSPYFGVTEFADNWGLYYLARELASLLPESTDRTELLEEIETWKWAIADGRGAKYQDKPAGRCYAVLHQIASILREYPQGEGLEPDLLNDSAEVDKLLRALDPRKLPVLAMTTADHKMIFTDPENGVLALLNKEYARHAVRKPNHPPPSIEREFRSRAFMLMLCDRLIHRARRTEYYAEAVAFKAQVESADWGWHAESGRVQSRNFDARATGQGARPNHQESFQQIFRTLVGLSMISKNLPGGEELDPFQMYSPQAVEPLLDFLIVDRVPVYFGSAELSVFHDSAQGALGVLTKRTPRFGVTAFSVNFGSSELLKKLTQMLNRFPDRRLLVGKEARSLLKDLEDVTKWQWTETDGGMIVGKYEGPSERFLRALYKIAVLLKRTPEGASLRPELIYTREEVQKFLDVLILGFVIPPLTADKAEAFRLSEIVELSAVCGLYGVTEFSRNFGARQLMINIANNLPDFLEKDDLLEAMGDDVLWGWKPDDGQVAKQGRSFPAIEKIYRAYWAISYIEALSQIEADLSRPLARPVVDPDIQRRLDKKMETFTIAQ